MSDLKPKFIIQLIKILEGLQFLKMLTTEF